MTTYAGVSEGNTSKKIMRPVMIGLHLLIVNIHVLQDKTAKKTTTVEGQGNISTKLCQWFKEDQLKDILRCLKPVLMNRIQNSQPTSSKQNHYQTKEMKTSNVAVTYRFRKRPSTFGQHFVLQKSQDQKVYCLCEKKVTKKNVNYQSYHIFHETLEIKVQKFATVEEENSSDDLPYQIKLVKDSKLTDATTSSYFSEQSESLQKSSVKRKKTTLRKMAKKSKMALSELPAYQKTSKSQAASPEQREEAQTQSTSSSETIDSRIGPRRAQTTLVIDLEKEPDGLKDIRKVEDLREDQLKYLINKMENYLRTIFRGEVYCRRHEDYKKGGKYRDDLNFQVGMAHFCEAQHECILSALVAMFCYRNNKYLDYVTKVMLPEALIKLYQDVHKTSFEEAEECLFNDTIRDF